MTLTLRIMTPNGVKVETEAENFTATGLEGEFGILPGHLPFLVALKAGPASYRHRGEFYYLSLGDGYAEVFKDEINIFVDSAETPDEIDVEQEREKLQKAEKALQQKLPVDSPEFRKNKKLLQRAQSKLSVVAKSQRR